MERGGAKIAIIGAGDVGATCAFSLLGLGPVGEIVLVDVNQDKAEGEALDLAHGASFVPPVNIRAGQMVDCAGADIVVLTAGARQREGETRLDLTDRNLKLYRDLVGELVGNGAEGIWLVVGNPVDLLTVACQQLGKRSPKKVIGSGTVLDSSRFRFLLGEYMGMDPRSIHAYVIGEHGDSEVLVWSLANVAGMSLEQAAITMGRPFTPDELESFDGKVKGAAGEVIARKGATYFAIALAVRRIVEAILRDEGSVLTVSTVIDGPYGIDGVALSLPCIVGRNGVERVLRVPLNAGETAQFRSSAVALRDAWHTAGERGNLT